MARAKTFMFNGERLRDDSPRQSAKMCESCLGETRRGLTEVTLPAGTLVNSASNDARGVCAQTRLTAPTTLRVCVACR